MGLLRCLILVFLIISPFSSYSEDYRIFEENSLGLTFTSDAQGFDSNLLVYLLDGSKTFPDTDAVQYERTVLNTIEAQGAYEVGGANQIRFGGQISAVYRSDYGKSSPRKIVREQFFHAPLNL